MAIVIITVLAVSAGASVFEISVTAHTPPWIFTTHAFISAAPNPVGVGQQTLISYGKTTQSKATKLTTTSDSATTNSQSLNPTVPTKQELGLSSPTQQHQLTQHLRLKPRATTH